MRNKLIFTSLTPILVLSPICACLCSCSGSIGDDYADKHCKTWYENLTKDPDDFGYTHPAEQHISPLYEASAVNLFTYFPGGKEGNSLLHINKGEIPKEMGNNGVQGEIGLPSYLDSSFNISNVVKYNISFKLGDYKVLENALNRCKCSPILTYHGMEDQEIELLNQINSIWSIQKDYNFGKDIANKSVLRQQDLNQLIGKTLDYDGFCATSIDRNVAVSFLNGDFSSEFSNKIFYEIEVDDNTNGAYVSSKNYLFNGIPLAGPHEYQLLLSSKLKLKVINAYGSNSISYQYNVLVIRCKGFHNSNQ